MSFDGFFVHSLVNELKESLENGRINRVFQPFSQELHLVIRSNRKNYRLASSIHPVYYQMHLTDEQPTNPAKAPLFAMILRKHIENSQILKIRQIQNDRIIEFELSGRDELGDAKSYLLIFELMGRHSNIILVDQPTMTIIDCIKHVPPYQNSYRTLLPGANYQLPPLRENQVNLFELTKKERAEWIKNHPDLLDPSYRGQAVQGLSRASNQLITYWIEHDKLTIEDALERFIEKASSPTPTLIKSKQDMAFYFTDLEYIKGERRIFNSLSELISTFYKQKILTDRISQMTGSLIQRLEHIIKRNKRKLKHLAKDRIRAQQADRYQLYGELIQAYLYDIHKGDIEATVINYYTNEPVTIPLNPQQSAVENSQRYFKRYTKYRDSLKFIDHQTRLAMDENDYLENILLQIEQADMDDIESIKEELNQQGYLKKQKRSSKRHSRPSKPRLFITPDNTRILVGRNNTQNDQLSMKQANKNYWWMHAKDIPGAHVIIEHDDPSADTLDYAAIIAAFYSKARDSANVPVDLVQVKHLRKPNGARPGFVIYEGQQTLFATPKEETIQSLQV
ncbi:Rqc2 family fibronectin-binding protein [Dolosicoccus paucivorans]|uniref:Rqc2 homolog RqcH n=1 Tax=Dolosicoccus paucivorans TaxID=84521 RepID=A0A2N6SPT1_9LACT|nr:NFACT RNA binding domain-containing protein [Dolosicoccus paucivorans]PMB84401.1 hypothetical protein CJ206_04020 [Dolosicoccus paucivorans]PMC59070.1 hypothetical protein CJ205_00985 [Dolosicoccus paucivorans]